jgi:acylglycerol lipase
MGDYGRAFSYGDAAWWASQGVTVYAYDQRGFGRGPHRGIWGGADLMAEDLRTVTVLVRARHPKAVVGVLGHSMGGAVAITAFASDRPPVADRLILAAPAVWGWREQPVSNKLALWLTAHIVPGLRISPPDWLTRKIHASDNIPVLLAMGRDRNMLFDTRVDAIYGLMQLMQQADDDLGQVKAPILYLYGARDEIIPRPATLHAARGLKPTDRSAFYPEGYHLLMRDLQGPKVWADVAAYLREPAAPLPSGAGALPKGRA